MKLGPNDLHLLYYGDHTPAKLFDHSGQLLQALEMRNRTVRNGTLFHWGRCPPGTFKLAAPVKTHAPAFGFWFVPVVDTGPLGPMRQFKRRGIGIHGGGSGLADPYANEQGWVVTHGCLRSQNRALAVLVHHIQVCQSDGGTCWLTVFQP